MKLRFFHGTTNKYAYSYFHFSLARSLPPSLFFLSRKYLFNYRVDKGAQNKSNRSMQQIILPTLKALTVGQSFGQGDWRTGEGYNKRNANNNNKLLN